MEQIYGSYDVVVVGGGTAGVSAAISSARTGAKTLLIERFGVLGGQMNVSGPPGFAYAILWNRRGEKCVAGIIEETHHRLEKAGHAMPYPEDPKESTYAFVDPDWWGLMIFEMMTENHVDLLLHSLCVDVVKQGDKVTGVIVENTSGRQIVLGKVVIDCTGEGDIASRAGAPYEKIPKEEIEIEPPSITFTMDGIDWEKHLEYLRTHAEELVDPWMLGRDSGTPAEKAIRERRINQYRNFRKIEDVVKLGCITFGKLTKELVEKGEYHEFGDIGFFFTPRDGGHWQAIFQHSAQVRQCDATDVREYTAGEVEARRQAVIALNAVRKYLPGFENAYLSRITSYLRVRETRRIMGDYKLGLADVQAARKHKDVIGKSCQGMGAFHVATIQTIVVIPNHKGIGDNGSFDLPYRILVPQKVENMLIAGKHVSTERNCYLRFLPDTMVTGQAAGVAAALCAKKGITPREMEQDVTELQDILQKQGAILFGTH